MTQVQHKTTPDIIPIIFYVFEDSTRPYTLLSYPASVHLGIVKFKVTNEASSHAVISAITNTSETQQVTLSTPYTPVYPTKRRQQGSRN